MIFGQLWHWGLVRNMWCGGPNELHQSMRVLLHFTQFCIQRQVRHPPYGPWDHVPPHVWTDKSNLAATQDEGEDEADVCALCCQRRSTFTTVVSARSIIVMKVLMPTLVGNKLFISQYMSNSH